MRHGETDWNRSQLVQGQEDQSRLTDEGRDQVGEVASSLAFESLTLIIASDLGRAQETAAIAGKILGLEIVSSDLLRERDFGTFEGDPRSALVPDVTGIRNDVVVDPSARPDGGETLHEMAERAEDFLHLVAEKWSGEKLLVVTHGGTIRVLEAVASHTPLLGSPWGTVDNCSLWRISPW